VTTTSSLHSLRESGIPHLETSPLSIKKILMATDFSEQSVLAAKYAARLAKQMGSQLEFVHIVPQELYVARPYMLASDLQKAELERGRSDLHEFAVKIPDVRVLRHKEIVLAGPAAELIVETLEERRADLLVMGSHGRSGVRRFAVGSIAEKVIRHVHRPVLVIGPNCARRYAWLKSVLLAADLPVGSLRAAQYAVSIARQSGADVTITHVLPERPGPIDPAVERTTLRALLSLVPHDAQLSKHVHFRVARGDTAQTILRIAKDCNAGLIVTGPKKCSVLADHAPGAVLSKLIAHAVCPVLAVPPHLC
jgi:nucleotide-binding universal stress UspA family protein